LDQHRHRLGDEHAADDEKNEFGPRDDRRLAERAAEQRAHHHGRFARAGHVLDEQILR
jgi:hypothetical protein